MAGILAALGLALALGLYGYFKTLRDFRSGQNDQKLIQAQKAIKSVQKTKNAYSRLDADQRSRLRDKYGRGA